MGLLQSANMKQAFGLRQQFPGLPPWAGMKDAFGVILSPSRTSKLYGAQGQGPVSYQPRAKALGSSPASPLQANGLPHHVSRAFSARDGFWAMNPGLPPWAGMNDAFGVSSLPTKLLHSCPNNCVVHPGTRPHSSLALKPRGLVPS
jgi:hypothetical protein